MVDEIPATLPPCRDRPLPMFLTLGNALLKLVAMKRTPNPKWSLISWAEKIANLARLFGLFMESDDSK